ADACSPEQRAGVLPPGRLAGRIAPSIRGQAKLREQHVASTGEPACDIGQERKEVLIRRTVCPAGIDGIAVHREDVAYLGGLTWPEHAIVLQVFHVQANREPGVRVGRANGGGDPTQPPTRRRVGRRYHAVRVLVPQVPHPDGFVASQGSGCLGRKQGLRSGDERVRVPVPQSASIDTAVGYDATELVTLTHAR